MKICRKCKIEKTLDHFNKFTRGRNGLNPRCIECYNQDNYEYVKKWRQKNNEKHKQQYKEYQKSDRYKELLLKRNYDLSLDEFKKMVDKQKNLCAICHKPEPTQKCLAVDHCHTTGKVRGLLCSRCNPALGGFMDNIQNLKNAIKYLKTS